MQIYFENIFYPLDFSDDEDENKSIVKKKYYKNAEELAKL